MLGKKKRTSDNPEVQKAMEERDTLLAGVKDAVEKVDDLLLEQYEEANGVQ